MNLGLNRFGAQLRPFLVTAYGKISDGAEELGNRLREAARDARHRLRTGRPRGVPSSFVHPPLECSKACSQAARRVHGLLYGYSLAYEEVRPRVETIAQALGYSKSTTYNATAELRRAGLLIVHERRGLDHRRVANRYEVLTSATGALTTFRGGSREEQKRTSEHQKTVRRIENSEISNERSKTDNPNAPPPSACRPGLARSVRRRRTVGVPENQLADVVGLECFRMLKSAFGGDLAELRLVITEHGAIDHPDMLKKACDALVEQRRNIDNPAAYLRGILRRQFGELEGIQHELSEVMEQYRQACDFGDPNRKELESKIVQLQSRAETRRHKPTSEAPVPKPDAVTERSSTTQQNAAEPESLSREIRPRTSPSLEHTVTQLKQTNLSLARIVARQLDPAVAAGILNEEAPHLDKPLNGAFAQ